MLLKLLIIVTVTILESCADVLFMIDSSGSMAADGQNAFVDATDFAARLVTRFTLGQAYTRVSGATFGNNGITR